MSKDNCAQQEATVEEKTLFTTATEDRICVRNSREVGRS